MGCRGQGRFPEEGGFELASMIIMFNVGGGLRCYSIKEVMSIKNVNEKER